MRCEYQYFRIFDFGGFLDIEKAKRVLEGAFLVHRASLLLKELLNMFLLRP